MPDERELWELRGDEIIKSPNNDDLRLAFANDLEQGEQSDEENRRRARFIRVQVRLGILRPSHPEWMRLATEAYGLLLDYGGLWMSAWFRDVGIRGQFHRGFIELVRIRANVLLELQARLFEQAPIRHLDIVELSSADHLKRLLDSLEQNKHLSRVISMRLDGQGLRNEHMEMLHRPSLARLRWLSLAHNDIGEAGAMTLATQNFAQLVYVDLHDNPFDPAKEPVYDQGVVIEQRAYRESARHTDVPWLRRRVLAGQVVQPDRFQLARDRSAL
jgi:uncharacterized protein (TIGR02996 family)